MKHNHPSRYKGMLHIVHLSLTVQIILRNATYGLTVEMFWKC